MTTEGFTPAKYAYVLREVRKAQHDAWEEGFRTGFDAGYASALPQPEDEDDVEHENPYPLEES